MRRSVASPASVLTDYRLFFVYNRKVTVYDIRTKNASSFADINVRVTT